MEGLGFVDTLVLVLVTVNSQGLWGWLEVLSVWNLQLMFEDR